MSSLRGVGIDFQSDVEYPNIVDDTTTVFDEGTVCNIHTPSSVFPGTRRAVLINVGFVRLPPAKTGGATIRRGPWDKPVGDDY